MSLKIKAASKLTLLFIVVLLLSSIASAQEENSFEEFIDFMKAEVAKDDAVRAKNKDRGIGLDLNQELGSTRKTGLATAFQLLDMLDRADQKTFPGIAALSEDLGKSGVLPDAKDAVEDWDKFDTETLLTKNPNFWRAYYEVAPGQGVMEALYGSLLKAEGECLKSLQISVIARLGNRKEGSLRSYHLINATQNQAVFDAARFRITQGIEHFDKNDFEKAATTFAEILNDWPQCGLASFELGLTHYHQKEHKAGREVTTRTIEPGDPALPSKQTYDLYATARKHDPMIRNAYQGTAEPRSIIIMAKVVLPAYRILSDFSNKKLDASQLGRFGAGCQLVGLHDYALFSRQVYISSKNKFDKKDLEFIQENLRAMVGKESAAEIINGLSKKEVVQFSFKLKEGNQKK